MSLPARWHVRVLGTLRATDGEQTLERFGAGSVAALLARLAMYPGRSHAREELVELLWPGVALDVGRNRLRQALFALRTLLEPPGSIARPVLVADRDAVRVHDGALDCDAVAFERAVREGREAEALLLYVGELLPGRYEDWVLADRARLADLAERAAAKGAATAPAQSPGAPRPVRDHEAPAAVRRERASLPVYLTRFFGRDDALARLRETIVEHRLVTLLGAGGIGKTRLAVQLATRLRDDGAAFDPLLFVPLVGCSTQEALLDALRTSLGLGDSAAPLERIVDALADRQALLVLDNFEQLVEAGAGVLTDLVARLPRLHLLVTSRRALGLDGERSWPLPPLTPPPRDASLAEAAANPAVALFIDRARAARTDFHLGERNREALVALAGVLDGLPLALELAASRIRSLSPVEMLAQLGAADGGPRALELLARSGPRAGLDPRHASMQRTLEWSWQLLDASAQRLLAELTVFEAPFDASAAGQVATPAAQGIAVRLDDLVAHSLLTAQPDATDHTQYTLPALIRDFAASMLDAGTTRALRTRHRDWLVRWAGALPATPSLAAVRTRMPDLAAAVGSALADGVAPEGVRLLVAWRRVLLDTPVPAALLAQLAPTLAATPVAALASRGHTVAARLALNAGQADAARDHAERGVALARRAAATADDGDELLARALHGLASTLWRTLRSAERTEACLDEAQPHADRCGDAGLQASLLALRGFVTNIARRDLAQAQALHGEALALWERAGDGVAANNGRYNLAVCAMRARRFDEALERLQDVADHARAQHDWRLLSQVSNVVGEACSGQRRWREAASAYRHSLELAWNLLASQPLAYALWNLPHALVRLHETERAAMLGAAAARYWTAHVGPLDAGDRRQLELLQRQAARLIGAGAVRAAWRAGESLGTADAVALALRD